ncbi:MAG: serine/threonine protein kinase, partial [Armatimonadetes bacterium]|nr:serine/threonine protein kinase [Armatimonadota bacterium]
MENQSPHALPSGTLLGRGLYRLEECLGQGGFGITYRAVEPVGNQPVVVKELFPRGAMRQGATVAPDAVLKPVWSRACEQFRQEGECLQRLSHPGVVRVYGVLEENNTVYLVMAYVEGEVLSAYLERQGGRLPVEEVVAVAEQVADALQTVHAAGWLHRDLKPHNLYRRKDGQLVLLDFGAARQFQADETGTHSVILTTGMAPPEQYRTKAKRGAFTDVYGLAATLYVLLT